MTMTTTKPPFTRTRFTWFAYALQYLFAAGIALPGPVVPFIGEQLGLNYTQRGLHFTLLAAGNLVTGLFGDRVVARFGNRASAWGFVALEVVGVVGLIYGPSLWVTLPGVFILGIGSGGCTLLATAALADAHPAHQARALTEANIYAGMAVALTPLTVGLLARVGLGWQAMALVVLALVALMVLAFWRVPFPPPRSLSASAQASGSGERPLPPLYWLFGAVLFMTVAIEWVIISWAPDFLATVRGFDPGTAAALGSGFAWAIVVGRVLGRWLLEIVPEERVLVGAYALIFVLFPLYVYAPSQAVSLGALVLLGLAQANQFPLALSAAMDAGGDQTSRASARVSVFGGLATLTLPQTVGSLADVVGIQAAYGLVLVLAAVAVAVAVFALNRRARLGAA